MPASECSPRVCDLKPQREPHLPSHERSAPARYCAEFDFRYNTRLNSDAERADKALKGIAGKRLTYRRIDRLAA